MADYGTKWIDEWLKGANSLNVEFDPKSGRWRAIPDKNGWVKNPGWNVWPDGAVVEWEGDDGSDGENLSADLVWDIPFKDGAEITRSRLAKQQPETTPEEDEAFSAIDAWQQAAKELTQLSQDMGLYDTGPRDRSARLWPIVKHFAEGGDVGTFDAGHIYKQDDPNWNDRGLQIIKKTRTTWLYVYESPEDRVAAQRAVEGCLSDSWIKVPGTERVEEVE